MFLSFGLQHGRGKERKGIGNQLKDICALPNFTSTWCITQNEPHLQAGISKGLLPSSSVFPSVAGEVVEGTGCSCLVHAVYFQGTRTAQNHRPLKDQRQREKLAPKSGRSLGEIDYKTETGFCV